MCENRPAVDNGPDHQTHKPDNGVFRNTEIVIGLVGAVGTQQKRVAEAIADRLKAFQYDTRQISVSRDVISVLYDDIPSSFMSEFDRISTFIDRGNRARQSSGDNSILAMGVCSEIFRARKRDDHGNVEPGQRIAYIVSSLKHPKEVRRLRRVYGDGFYLFGIYSSKDMRRDYLVNEKGMDGTQAEDLIKRDEDEVEGHGQHTRDTFHLADFFIHLSDHDAAWKNSLWRILDLVFGNPYITPNFDEYAMFMAFASALRSADLSRQVGAVIARDNEILATGANDCPKPGGGLYWPEYDRETCEYADTKNGRDYKRGEDSNKKEQRKMIDEILSRLDEGVDKSKVEAALLRSRIGDLTEYGRAVHAEMEALLFCARNAIDARGATLYATTFPCHNCAKHIIAAGIARVVYVEPYPKSKALDFHDDAIEQTERPNSPLLAFEPFVGIGPRKFFDLFSMRLSAGYELARKDQDGRVLRWQRAVSCARIQMLPYCYLDQEVDVTRRFAEYRLGLESRNGTGTGQQ
ncbi:MAG TPA: anti-phage dCTP deaminase [Sedimentisphaerales bacterium]|nr:anti-phage dCTP deaminase [Sedimentisphaerales bacterium]HNU31563.1 anti-phage dCTP deaminase [Sedimentisphaerales bacterium]